MSTAAEVRAVWKTYVWDQSTIQALTKQIYNYDIASLSDESIAHRDKLYANQCVYFIQYTVNKRREMNVIQRTQAEFSVIIQIYKEADIDGLAYNALIDAVETIYGVVNTTLGSTWQSTVDYWRPENGLPAISAQSINNKPVWVCEYEFLGYQSIDL